MRTTLSYPVLWSLMACGGAPPSTVTEQVQAIQTRPVAEFDGIYDTHCAEAALALHGSFHGRAAEVRLPVRCEPLSEEERTEVQRQIEGRCRDTGLPGPLCQQAALALVQGTDELHRRTLDLLPAALEVRVHSGDALGRLTGLYPATFTHQGPSGARSAWRYVINNHAGPDEGAFATVGLAVSGLGAIKGLACAEVTSGGVQGRLDRTTGRLSAAFALGRQLTCAAWAGDRAVPISFGLHSTGRLSGARR